MCQSHHSLWLADKIQIGKTFFAAFEIHAVLLRPTNMVLHVGHVVAVVFLKHTACCLLLVPVKLCDVRVPIIVHSSQAFSVFHAVVSELPSLPVPRRQLH